MQFSFQPLLKQCSLAPSCYFKNEVQHLAIIQAVQRSSQWLVKYSSLLHFLTGSNVSDCARRRPGLQCAPVV